MIRLATGGIGLPQTITRGLGGVGFLYADTFWAALRAFLKAQGTLTDLTEVYFRNAAPGFRFPCLIFTPIDDQPTLTNTSEYWESSVVQFTILATDDVTADTLGVAAYKAIAPKVDDGGAIVIRPKIRAVDSYEMGTILGFKRRASLAGRGPRNQNVWAFHFQATILVGRSMVS